MMTPTVEELIARLEKGEEPAALSWSLLPEEEQVVLQRCALVHTFERELVSEVLDPRGRVPFERLEQHSLVEPVPRSEGLYRLRESARRKLLDRWSESEPSFQELQESLSGYFQRKGAGWELESLYHLLASRPADAVVLAEKLWEEFNQRFDLAQCNDLLAILDEREAVLDPKLQERREDWRRYLRTRSFWSDEYTRTARFYERQFLRKRLDALMRDDGAHWALHLHAPGGMGKSMLLRWVIARWCVPARVPCARIDFDVLDPITCTRQPWRVLLELARQLDLQLPRAPFQSFIRWLEDYTSSSRMNFEGVLESLELGSSRAAHTGRLLYESQDRFISVLQETWQQRPVLFILDTVEEALLRPGSDLERIVEPFVWMRSRYPPLRLILAGRYDLTERLPALARRLGPGQLDVQRIEPFTEDEARAYLREKRGLGADPRLEIAVRKSEGSPFKLALFADLLQSNPRLSSEEIAAWSAVDLLYLIERVVERIENPRVRWLLRYGVVPRRLTFTFVEKVMARYLREAMSGVSTLDEPTKDALPATRGEVFQKNLLSSAGETVDFRELWEELNRYASPFSWVYPAVEQPETLVFHGDVLHPMRRLLQGQDVFQRLHEEAVAYFERRAEQEPELQVELTREALYHRFQQGDAKAAGSYWRWVLERALDSGKQRWAHELAGELLGSDYLDEDGRPRRRADGSPLILDETLAQANHEFARSCVWLARHVAPGERARLLEVSGLALDRVEQLEAAHGGVRFVARARVMMLRGALVERSSPAEALQFLQEAVRTADSDAERYEAGLLLGDMLAHSHRPDEAQAHYRTALGLVAKVAPGDLQAWLDVLEHFVTEAARAGRLLEAQEEVERALEMVRVLGALEEQQKLLLRRFELDLQAGEPARGLNRYREGDWVSGSLRVRALLLKARAQLMLRSSDEAMRTVDLLRDLLGGPQAIDLDEASRARLAAQASELHADLLDAFLESFSALEELSLAGREWRRLGDMEGVIRCRARSARLQLVALGDLQAARQTLRETTRSDTLHRGEAWISVQLVQAELEDRAGNGGEAREIVDSLLALDLARPLALQVRIALQGLARKNAPTPDVYLELLVSQLERLPTVAARLALLEPLRDVLPRSPLPPMLKKWESRWMELVGLEGAAASGSPLVQDGLLQGLRRVEVLRLCGREEQAERLLVETSTGLLSANGRFALREALLAEDRLGWNSPRLRRVLKELKSFLRDFGMRPNLCAAVLTEQAERLNLLIGKGWESGLGNLLDFDWLLAEAYNCLSQRAEVPHPRLLSRLEAVESRRNTPIVPAADQLFPGPAPAASPLQESQPHGEPRAGDEKLFIIDLKTGPLLLVSTQLDTVRDSRTVGAQIPGLREQLEAKGRVFSYGLLKRFVSDWHGLGKELGAALLSPEIIRMLERPSQVLDVQVRTSELRLAPVPWEFLVASGRSQRLLCVSEPTRFFYRSSSALPRIRSARARSSGMEVLLVRAEVARDRSRREDPILRAVEAYESLGITPTVVDGRLMDKVLSQESPAVVHICADLDESPSVGEIFFNIELRPRTAEFLSPSRLDRMLKRTGRPDAPVLVVLDVPSRAGPTELATQLFLRNAFAAELFSLGSVAAILGTGLDGEKDAHLRSLEMIRALSEGASVGEVSRRLRTTILEHLRLPFSDDGDAFTGLSELPLLKVLGPIGTALFTNSPDWVPLPERANRGRS